MAHGRSHPAHPRPPKRVHARSHIHAPAGVGDWAADHITAFAGGWPFVWLHVAWFAAWFVLRLDVNLLTLIVSLEAIFLATFVLMSERRSGERDKLRDDREAAEVEEDVQLTREIHALLGQNTTLTQQVHDLTTQVHEVVTLLRDHIQRDRANGGGAPL